LGAVVVVSALTSAVVSAGILLGVQSGVTLLEPPQPVPDVTGMTPTGAGALLQDQGLSLMVDGEVHDPDVEVGHICRQEPRSGSHLERGAVVHVHTSLGPEPVTVPRVAGRAVAEATAALEEAGLTVGGVTREEGEGEPDTVLRSAPAAGERVEPGARVALVALPATRMVEVPDVGGQSVRRARSALEEAGLTVGEERRRFDDLRRPYIILEQEPEAGAEVPEGSAVNLVVNEG
jgi:serine/threonine-protein kinase